MTDERRLHELASAPEPRLGGIGPTVLSLQGVEGVTEVLLIRHAQMPPSDPMTEDPSLTEVGREQAETLGAFLAATPLDAVISSPTRRCRETAEAVAAHHGLTIETNPDLREVDSYAPGGQSLRAKLDTAAWEELRVRMRRERSWDIRGEEYGESSAALRRRATAAVDAAIAAHPGGHVALVTHGPTINAYLADVMGSPHDLHFLCRLASVCVVWAKDDRRDLRLLNGMGHFATL